MGTCFKFFSICTSLSDRTATIARSPVDSCANQASYGINQGMIWRIGLGNLLQNGLDRPVILQRLV